MAKIFETNLICSYCGNGFIRTYRVSKSKQKGFQFCCIEHRKQYYIDNPPNKGKEFSKETKQKMSSTRKELIRSGEINLTGENSPVWNGGKPKCIDCGKGLENYGATRCTRCSKIGELSPVWKGGIVKIYERIRHLDEYKKWRIDVFTRDSFTCVKCNKKSDGDLEAHHIRSVSSILKDYQCADLLDVIKIELLWDINNGKTLCKTCHKETHKDHRRKQIWD